jgi:hypothetical protein
MNRVAIRSHIACSNPWLRDSSYKSNPSPPFCRFHNVVYEPLASGETPSAGEATVTHKHLY